MIITNPNLKKAKLEIKKSIEKPIVVKAQNLVFDRKILEYGKFQILLDPKNLNHIMAKIATKNQITIGFDISKITSLDKKEKAIKLIRIINTIKVARKAKTQIKLLNYKDKKDASALLLSLGSSTQQTAKAF